MENPQSKIGNYRWVIISLLLFSTTINYMDRQVISYLKPFFCTAIDQGGFGWSNTDFSFLTSFFTGIYAIMTIIVGPFIDKVGTKLGLAISLVTWSIFGIVNAFAGAAISVHVFIRSLFAVGEAGNFPASNKTVAEWFPKKERALAIGIFNAGASVGAMISALLVPGFLTYFGLGAGWKMSFIVTGASGFLWLIFWFVFYNSPEKQKRLSKSELEYILQDDKEDQAVSQVKSEEEKTKVPWMKLWKYRQTWSFFWGKFFTDGVWWFYLFWLPDYLIKQFGMTTLEVRWPTFIVYGFAIVGSVFGGSIPLFMINRGLPVYKARMRAMLIIAVFPLTVLTTQYFGSTQRFGSSAMWLAVAVICVGAAAHQAWSANLFTTVSDMFPKKAIASITGIGTMAGGIGGVTIQMLAGRLTDFYISTPKTAYMIMFCICASCYLIAWSFMKTMVPKYKLITDL